MSEFISELKAAWIGNRRRKFYQSTRGIMTPEERRELEEGFDRKLAEHDRQVVEKTLLDVADDVDARWDDTGLGAVGSSWLRARAEAYRQERKDDE